MKKSIEKFIKFIYSLDISEAEFARNIGLTRNALNKYLNKKRKKDRESEEEGKERELSTEYAINVSKSYKIDFFYFYDDSIEISLDPIKEHPVVDNKRVSKLQKSVEDMAIAMTEMTKKFEKSNSSNLKMLKEIANDVINEFISTTIKLDSVSKPLLNSEPCFRAIVEANDRALINYAKKKSLDFINTINSLDKTDAISISHVMKEIYNFKLENATYVVQMNQEIKIISKQVKIIPYSEKLKEINTEYHSILEKIKDIEDKDINDAWIELDSAFGDFLNVIDYSNLFLFRDLINNLDYKELQDDLKPIVRDILYDKDEFAMESNPKTLERISRSFIDLIEEKDPIKEIYDEVIVKLNKMKELIDEKGIGGNVC